MNPTESLSTDQNEKEPTMERHQGWLLSKIKDLSEKHPKLVRGVADAIWAAPIAVGSIGGMITSMNTNDGFPNPGLVGGGAVLGGLISLSLRSLLRKVAEEAGIDVAKLYEMDNSTEQES